MKKKQGLRAAIFLLLTAALVVVLCFMFKLEKGQAESRFATYRSLQKNEVDAIYIGSSAVDRYWIAAQAYEDYGMTVYPLSADANPPWLIKNLIREGLAYQDPQLIIIDVRGFTEDASKYNAKNPARTIEQLSFFSLNRIEACRDSMEFLNKAGGDYSWDDIFLYLPIVQFHNRWEDEGFSVTEVLPAEESDYLGFYTERAIVHTPNKNNRKKLNNSVETDARAALDPLMAEELETLIEYLNTLDAKVLFIDNPHYETEKSAGRVNTVADTVTAAGFDFCQITISDLVEEYDLNTKKDFYNAAHTNFYGAGKFTSCLSSYLSETYDLPDHRDGSAPDFDGVYAKLTEKIAQLKED